MVQASSTRWDSYADSLKLGDAELQALIAARRAMYDARKTSQPAANVHEQRTNRRLSVQGTLWVPAEMREANGNVFRLKVYPIDFSSSGMCFFSERFLHPGTTCTLTLRLLDGEMLLATAKVVRCEFIQGQAHEVGVELDERLDMALFFPNVPAEVVSPIGAVGATPPRSEKAPEMPSADSAVSRHASLSPGSVGEPAISRHGDDVAIPMVREAEQKLRALVIELSSVADLLAKPSSGKPRQVANDTSSVSAAKAR